jgi:hypothetical protein
MPRPMSLVIALVASGACATGALPLSELPPGPAPHPDSEEPKSWDELIEEAREHEQRAESHALTAEAAETAPQTFKCAGDPLLSEQLTSGTEPLTHWTPCWDTRFAAVPHQRFLANKELLAAEQDLARAASMAEEERDACGGLAEENLERSLFSRADDVAEVIRIVDGDEVRGARIVLAADPDLEAQWVAKRIACHRARFAMLGMNPRYMPSDPTLVADTQVTVTERDGRIEVTILGEDDLAANVALGRATDLAARAEQTARR